MGEGGLLWGDVRDIVVGIRGIRGGIGELKAGEEVGDAEEVAEGGVLWDADVRVELGDFGAELAFLHGFYL
jgi:hypothetical protein